ncbi:MAG: hypothetical protein GF353_28305 [Candidatus Lokiarchaeota archaeon]|nr:hypothetical protein [Candidatus Lokiarchaeota archaeon]
MKILSSIKKIYKKIREFLINEKGGNLIEYALLIGFALFIFFLLVGVVASMLDWAVVQGEGFKETAEELDKIIRINN